jgi:hypothetical protein
MDEAKRFFRFILPGLSSLVEFNFFAWLLLPTQWGDSIARNRDQMKDLGTVVGLLIGSGGVGFILSNIYHAISWGVCRGCCTLNHRRLIRRASAGRLLRLFSQDGGAEVSVCSISRVDAWRIATAIWHARVKTSTRLEGANARADTLTSIVHGLGTLLVGTVAASGISVWLGYDSAKTFSILAFREHRAFLIGVGLLVITQSLAFFVAVKHADRVIDMILFEELRYKPADWYIP